MLVLWILVSLFIGLVIGLWFGLAAFAAQRDRIDRALSDMSDSTQYLASLAGDGRVHPDTITSWIATIRRDFTPSRKWN